MKIAVLSDLHENYHNLRWALQTALDNKVDHVFFLGDYINPGIAKELFEFCNDNKLGFNGIHGNNDADSRILLFATESGVNHSAGEFDEFEIDNKKVFLTHYPEVGKNLDRSKYDAIFFGHNHTLEIVEEKSSIIDANPGELSAHKSGRATFIIWDTKTMKLEIKELSKVYNPNS